MRLRQRKHTVTWYDVEHGHGVEACFEVLRADRAADPKSFVMSLYERLVKGFAGDDFALTARWTFWAITGDAPYQRAEIDGSDDRRVASYTSTALGLLVFSIMDRLPEPGFRIVSESEDD